jgi:hypothetical protein
VPLDVASRVIFSLKPDMSHRDDNFTKDESDALLAATEVIIDKDDCSK